MEQAHDTLQDVRDRIVHRRRERIALQGHDMGARVPATRQTPLQKFVHKPLLICEIKRRSPSRGDIAVGLDPVAQARLYHEAGVRSVSVLTEEDHFGGRLEDLMAIKKALPDLALLRKDFLVDCEDVRVSHRAGADAILLIASMLEFDLLRRMHDLAVSLGMAVLVEVHSQAEIDLVRPLGPALTGINCRDLQTFRMDLLLPPILRPRIDWDCQVVFESGIFEEEDARFARHCGFDGLLVGEAVVRKPQRIAALQAGLRADDGPKAFWSRIAGLLARYRPLGRPILKVCGITNLEDAQAAVEAGADILGLIFAQSPRRCPADLPMHLARLPVLKVGVAVDQVEPALAQALDAGWIDGVQFSGHEQPGDCAVRAWPYYKTLHPQTPADLGEVENWRCPRVLLDAFSPDARGGTGRQLNPEILGAVKAPLWLAGGLNPGNIGQVVRTWRPELVDLASGVEASPGKKSHEKLTELAKELENAIIQ